ncbi:MAG: hypothetical protein AB1540_05110 [Bdellovibrionota bacterium]
MANRDRSQNVGFVYTNIYELYKKSKEEAAPLTSNSRVLRAEELGNIKITKFQPRSLSQNQSAAPVSDSNSEQPKGANPFDDLKSNLNRLQDLHAKLRFMLKELEDLVNSKK